MRVTKTLSAVFCASMFLALSPAMAASAEKPADDPIPTIPIPQNLITTPEDAAAIKRFGTILERMEKDYYRALTAEELIELMTRGGLEAIDPHSSIWSPKTFEDMRTSVRGTFGGLGIEVTRTEQGAQVQGILVVSPIDDTPAARAGIQPRDIIVEIILYDENSGEEIERRPTAKMSLQEAVDLMRGKKDTSLGIRIVRQGSDQPIEKTLVREIIRIQYVKAELKRDAIGYIRISSFGGEKVVEHLKQTIEELVEENGKEPLEGLVLDMRNNPGGLLDQSLYTARLFLEASQYSSPGDPVVPVDMGFFRVSVPESSIILSEEARGKKRPIAAAINKDILQGAPMVILVNSGCASACEIVSGILQMRGRAVIASTDAQTFGKGTVQTIIPLGKPLGSEGALRLTTSQYLIGSVSCERPVQGIGIRPDILLTRTDDDPPPLERTEKSLDGSVTTSSVSDADCKYRFSVPDDHKAAAYHMLEVMDLEPLDPAAETVN